MSRVERFRSVLSRGGVRLLLLELLIVFLGVYGAFALQSFSEDRKLDAERQRVLVGIKQDLEFFRVFFPGFTGRDVIEERRSLIAEGRYRDYSDWRFLQPQYDYTAIEYALGTGADVVDYELNEGLAGIYLELRKLRHAEDLMTTLAMSYRPIPEGAGDDPEIRLARSANFQGFVLMNDRARDRAEIMMRVAQLSAEVVAEVNRRFTPGELREVELQLLRARLADLPVERRAFYFDMLDEAFPNLSRSDIEDAAR